MNEFEESLARLGDNESNKTRKILIELDEKLYSNDDQLQYSINSEDNMHEFDHMDYYRGYDAILECVDDKEILTWKKTFSYLQIIGEGIQSNQSDDVENTSDLGNQEESWDESRAHVVVNTLIDDVSLVVQGRKMDIRVVGSSELLEDEEVICSHGTLEEVLEIDNSPIEQNPSESLFLSIDPKNSHKIEVVNSLYDVLVPDLTIAIAPLVKRLVCVCRERGIDYSENMDDKSSDGNHGCGTGYSSEELDYSSEDIRSFAEW